MRALELNKITKLYFGYEELVRVLHITNESAKISANRYVKSGILIRLKRNFYVLREKWNALPPRQKYTLANFLQSPSYISLTTALEYYEITTQIQRGFIESIVIKRTKEIEKMDTVFNYTKIKENLYFGFVKQNDFFIATPEKAFADAIYLSSLGRYNLDLSAIDFGKFDKNKLTELVSKFPLPTQKAIGQYDYS